MIERKNSATLSLPDSVTFENAAVCSKELADALSALKKEQNALSVDIDVGNVKIFDSSVLAVLLQCRRDAAFCQLDLHLRRIPSQLQELCKLYGVQGLLFSPET